MELGKPLLYLPRAAVESLGLGARPIADAIESLIARRAAGAARSAPKAALPFADGRLFQAMLAHADEPAYGAAKIIGLAQDNAARELPHISAVIVLQDGESGAPVAIMDGGWITEVRTAALTLVAARRLARDDAAVAGFVGCGAQARSHLEALAGAYPLRAVRACSRSQASAARLAGLARDMDLEAETVSEARAAVEDCDLVVTTVPAVAGLEPFLNADWLKPGAFASLVDLGRSWLAEPLARIDRLVIDDREQEAHAAAPLVEERLVSADLSELVSGAAAGRTRMDQRTVFVFRGIALADLAAAVLVYERARERGVGEVLAR
ncbi:MAG: ornithine cyclodeaminase family protein [Gammaproteobacteria bacterium]|nr:ornithine cyclodeaminase family protein [Gammaproteobacteria bacterium]